jgi:hypothetical protein
MKMLSASGAGALDIRGFQSFVAGDHIKDDGFTFVQRLETVAHDGRVMHKNVLPRVLGDKTKAFFDLRGRPKVKRTRLVQPCPKNITSTVFSCLVCYKTTMKNFHAYVKIKLFTPP